MRFEQVQRFIKAKHNFGVRCTLSSELTIFWRTFRSGAESKTFVSSANILNVKTLEQFGKSFLLVWDLIIIIK